MLRQGGGAGGKIAFRGVLGAEHRHAVAFSGQLSRQKQAEQAAAEDGGPEGLFPQEAFATFFRSPGQGGGLQVPDGDAFPQFQQLAAALAGGFAPGAEQVGEGGDFFVQAPGLLEFPGGHMGNQGLDVQLQGAGGAAIGRLLVDAQMLPGFQLFFGEQPLLVIDVGGGPFFKAHERPSFQERQIPGADCPGIWMKRRKSASPSYHSFSYKGISFSVPAGRPAPLRAGREPG